MRVEPWTVAMRRTPRSHTVRAASTSSLPLISSTMTASGVAFSTASCRIWGWSFGSPQGSKTAEQCVVVLVRDVQQLVDHMELVFAATEELAARRAALGLGPPDSLGDVWNYLRAGRLEVDSEGEALDYRSASDVNTAPGLEAK